jgi:centrosomal protein CEP19
MSFITQGDFNSAEASFPDYQPKRFGLKYTPPMITLEYLVPSTGKLYHHKIRVRNLTAATDEAQVLAHIKHRHAIYLGTSKITDDQLLGLLRKLKAHACEEEVDYHTFDLNKLPPEEVKQHKDRMEGLFRQNSKQPGDEDYEYDLRRDFQPPVEKSEWDEEEDF